MSDTHNIGSISANGGLMDIFFEKDIVFSIDFLLFLSQAINYVNREDVYLQRITFTDTENISFDKETFAYIYILAIYFKDKHSVFFRKGLYNKIIKHVHSKSINDYEEIQLEDEILKRELNLYTIVNEDTFTTIVDNLVQFIISKALTLNKLELKDYLSTTIGEIFANARYHSNEKKFYFFYSVNTIKDKIYLNIHVIDFGNTLCQNVKKFYKKNKMGDISSIKCFEWAIKWGTTTRLGSGGYGLPTLIDYMRKANGRLIILSDEAYYELVDGQETFTVLDTRFPGTTVTCTVPLFDKSHVFTVDKDENHNEKIQTINLSDI